MPRYTSSGKPRGVPLTWQLSEEEQATACRYLPLALATAARASRRYGLDLDECQSIAQWALCLIVHQLRGDYSYIVPVVRRQIRRSIKVFMAARCQRPVQQFVSEPGRCEDVETIVQGRLLWQTARRVLSPVDYQILHEHMEGRTFQQIGADMERHAASVHERYQRALDLLRHTLGLLPAGWSGLGDAQAP